MMSIFSIKFAKNCLRNKKVKNLFPLNKNENKNARNREKYKINFAHTKRYGDSTVPSLQSLLNINEQKTNYMIRIHGT